jgi:hypothetical protein
MPVLVDLRHDHHPWLVVHTIIITVRRNLQLGVLGMRIWVNLTFVMATTLLALAGHLGEIRFGRWRSMYLARPHIILPPQWKLLGPFEAVDGMLMFGVSTALIFAVVNRLIHARFDDADKFLP